MKTSWKNNKTTIAVSAILFIGCILILDAIGDKILKDKEQQKIAFLKSADKAFGIPLTGSEVASVKKKLGEYAFLKEAPKHMYANLKQKLKDAILPIFEKRKKYLLNTWRGKEPISPRLEEILDYAITLEVDWAAIQILDTLKWYEDKATLREQLQKDIDRESFNETLDRAIERMNSL